MGSKLVVDRAKSGRSVIQAVSTHGPMVAEKVEARWAVHLAPKEKMPDVALLLRVGAKHLEGHVTAMEVADAENEAELSDDAEPRARRDGAYDALRATAVQVRATIENAWGSAGLSAFHWAGAVPTDASELVSAVASKASCTRSSAAERLPRP